MIGQFLAGWRAALRMARREARRTKGRSALVVAMIAVPVLGLSFAAVSYDMFRLTPQEKATRQLGAADGLVQWPSDGPVSQDPTSVAWSGDHDAAAAKTTGEVVTALPTGTRAVPYLSRDVTVRTAVGVATIGSVGLDVGDPLATGLVRLVEGRVPATGTEVALTRQAAARIGTGRGGTVQLPKGAQRYTVVGIVEFPADLHETVVFRPDAMPGDPARNPHEAAWLVGTPHPLTWDAVKQLNRHGIVVMSRAVLLDPPPIDGNGAAAPVGANDLSLAGLVAGLAVLEIVLLVGPAFAVGARRRRRELALVGANGGTPAHLRRIVLADGLVLGGMGAIVGVVLGIALALAVRTPIEEYVAHRRAGGYRVFPSALAAIALLAVLIGWLAALVPAFTAARHDLVTALAGRRGVTRSRRLWLVLGVVLCALGTATTVTGAVSISDNLLLAGLVTGELGLVLCTPALIGLISRVGRLLPLSFRIALRDTARNRASAAPAISAVMAAVAGSVALAVYLGASHQRDLSGYQPGLPMGYAAVQSAGLAEGGPGTEGAPTVASLTDTVRRNLPTGPVLPIRQPACPAGPTDRFACAVQPRLPPSRVCPYLHDGRQPTKDEQKLAAHDPRCAFALTSWNNATFYTVVDDGTALEALTGGSPFDLAAATAVLRSGGVVVGDPRFVLDGKVTLEVLTITQDQSGPPQPTLVTVPGYAMTSGVRPLNAILSPGALARTGLVPQTAGLLATTTRMPTQAEEDRLRAVLEGASAGISLSVERGSDPNWDPTLLILALAAGVITLGAAAIATGLAAADGRAELSTLAAVGASPRVGRTLSLSQSGVIAGLGSVLGSVAGLGAAMAVLVALNQAHADVWPKPERWPLTIPWLNLLVSLLVVPVVAMLGAGLLTRSRLPAERRRLT